MKFPLPSYFKPVPLLDQIAKKEADYESSLVQSNLERIDADSAISRLEAKLEYLRAYRRERVGLGKPGNRPLSSGENLPTLPDAEWWESSPPHRVSPDSLG